MKIQTCMRKGIHLDLAGGWTVSIQWGPFNYCGDYPNNPKMLADDADKQADASEDCEIAIWDKNDRWINFGEDQVKGFVPVSKILWFVLWLDQCAHEWSFEDVQARAQRDFNTKKD